MVGPHVHGPGPTGFSTDEGLRGDAYRKMTAIFLEHNPWIGVLRPYEDHGLQRQVEFTPNPDQQLELQRFNFRLRRGAGQHESWAPPS